MPLSEHMQRRIADAARNGADTMSIVSQLIDSDVGMGSYLLDDGEVDEATVDVMAEYYTAAVETYRKEQA